MLPLATSIDGRSFSFQASLYDLEFRVGGYVTLTDGADVWLGQVLTLELGFIEEDGGDALRGPRRVTAALGHGHGARGGATLPRCRGEAGDGCPGRGVARCRTRPHGSLDVGELADVPGVPARLDAGGFDRHTFLCGQSGSGKTYSLGVVLERLLTETGLRVVVLDPNSDYVRLTDVRPGADGDMAGRYRLAVHKRSRSVGLRPPGRGAARSRASELGADCRAALLQIDPVADREEYAAFTELLEHDEAGRPLISGIQPALLTSDLPGAREVGLLRGKPRRAAVGDMGAGSGWIAASTSRPGRLALPGRRSRIARDARVSPSSPSRCSTPSGVTAATTDRC